MTKKEAVKELTKLTERLRETLMELEFLKFDVEETKDSIEPYEGRNELTPQQEEREEWFDNLYDTLDSAIENIEDEVSNLEYCE